jgi:hypothetical protein
MHLRSASDCFAASAAVRFIEFIATALAWLVDRVVCAHAANEWVIANAMRTNRRIFPKIRLDWI